MNWRQEIIFNIFVWAGSKLFNTIAIYPNNGEDIEVVHFATSEQALAKSCHEHSENSIK